MKYYKKKDLNRYFLYFKNVSLEREFMQHKQNFRFAKMLVILSIIWSIISQFSDPNITRIFIMGIAGIGFFVGLHYLPQRFKQIIVFFFQVYTSYQIASAILTPIENWKALVNGASFMMLVLVEYQNILMESLAIISCLVLPIILLNIDKAFTLYLCILGISMQNKRDYCLWLQKTLKGGRLWQKILFLLTLLSRVLFTELTRFNCTGIKKSDFNDRYVSILKQLHIENIIQKGKIQPVQFPYTEKPTLYDYLLDKHASLYQSKNEEKTGIFNINAAFNMSSKDGGQGNLIRKKTNSQAVNASNTKDTIDLNQSKARGSNVSKNENGKKGRGSSPANQMMRRQSTSKKSLVGQSEKKKTPSDEYVEVSFFNEKQNQRQYFKVCIVPLLLQEPLLAISMEDITFISLYHQRMQQTKQTLTLTSLSFVKLKQKVDSIISQISNDQYKLKKEVLFVSHIVRAFTRIDPQKITFKTFSISKMIDEIKQLFPCVYRVKYKNESNMPVIVERKETKDSRKNTNLTNNFNQSPNSRENFKDNMTGELNQLQITRQNSNTNTMTDYTQLQLIHQNSSPTKRGREPINGMIYNHLQQFNLNNLHNSPTHKEASQQNHNVSINIDPYNDIDQVILSHSDAYILDGENNNNKVAINHRMQVNNLLVKKRSSQRYLSQNIPFSQECKTLQRINSLCNFINNYEQTMKDKTIISSENTPHYKNLINFSDKDSKERINSLDTYVCSSRCRLNSNFTNANNNTEESLQDREKITNTQTQTNTIFSNPNKRSQNLTNSQKKFGVISEILGVVEEKAKKESESQLTEDTTIQEFLICNNKSMIYYVLVGIISMFKDKKIEIIISLNQSNLYKSLKFSISPCIKMALSRRLTYYQSDAVYNLDDIYDFKTADDPYNFSLLSEKMFSRLNEICLLLGPSKIKQEPDLIEIEFFVDQTKINQQK